MLDPNTIIGMMFVSFFIGLITTAISQTIGRFVSLITTLPLVVFLIISLISGTKIEDVNEIGGWITVFLTDLIPLLLSYAAAGAGAGMVVGARRRRG